MAQLKMYWLKGTPVSDPELPEGYSLTNYKNEKDKTAWLECCKNGLIGDDAQTDVFDTKILGVNDINPETDVFFLDFNGEHIGTVTAIFHPDGNFGQMHMVGIRIDFRGRGLGKIINNAAIKKLNSQGVDYIYLTTDEWRTSAVKSYFSAGYIPVEYDTGMKERWEQMITQLGIDSVNMVNEDCSFCRVLSKIEK